jgi:ribosomal protein S18 acetylase RimI-like enzyme
MIIRLAEKTDYPWLKEQDREISAGTLEAKIAGREIYIAADRENPIGWLRYNLFWDAVPFMTHLYLAEPYRRRGIGTKLVSRWEAALKEKGYTDALTSTQSNEAGQFFYRKIGYTEIGGLKFLDEPYELIFHKKLS